MNPKEIDLRDHKTSRIMYPRGLFYCLQAAINLYWLRTSVFLMQAHGMKMEGKDSRLFF